MESGVSRFFYRKQSVDSELAAFGARLRIGELGDELKFLREYLDEDDPESFDDAIGDEERLFYAAGGNYGEIERLRNCTELEFGKFTLLQMKKNMLIEYERLQAKKNAKDKSPSND